MRNDNNSFNKHNLSEEELVNILRAIRKFEEEQKKKVERVVFAEMFPPEEKRETPKSLMVKEKLLNWSCRLMAGRLMWGCREEPLLSSKDVPSMVNVIRDIEGESLPEGAFKIITKFAESAVENFAELNYLPGRNQYEESWRWVNTILDYKISQGVSKTEVVFLENDSNEISRLMFSAEEFFTLNKMKINKSADPRSYDAIFQPLVDMLKAAGDEEGLKLLYKKIDEEFAPKLKLAGEMALLWLRKEVAIIYGKNLK